MSIDIAEALGINRAEENNNQELLHAERSIYKRVLLIALPQLPENKKEALLKLLEQETGSEAENLAAAIAYFEVQVPDFTAILETEIDAFKQESEAVVKALEQ